MPHPLPSVPLNSAWRDEALAPPVELALLRALIARQLSDEQARAVFQLIHSFRSWDAAHAKLLIETQQ